MFNRVQVGTQGAFGQPPRVALEREHLALAGKRRGRRLASSRPSLTTHMEVGLLALRTDWAADVEAAERWAPGRGGA